MTQLDSLTKFVTSNLPARLIKSAGFNAEMDEIKLQPSHKDLGLNQRRLGVITYEGVLSWDRFPFKAFDPQIVFALVLVWMLMHSRDNDFPIEEPVVDIEHIDDEVAILNITIGLADELCIKFDDKGLVPLYDNKWSVCSPEMWVASKATLYGADTTGAPVEADHD